MACFFRPFPNENAAAALPPFLHSIQGKVQNWHLKQYSTIFIASVYAGRT